eukprot:gene1904-1044_t
MFWKAASVTALLSVGVDVYLRNQSEKLIEVKTLKAPAPIGPYSQAIKQNGTLYCSGQIGIDAENENKISQDLEEQTKQTLKNLGEVLKAGGSDYDKVMKTTILLTDMNHFSTVNKVYSQYFVSEPMPARACFAVKTLPKNVLVEIECIAKTKNKL